MNAQNEMVKKWLKYIQTDTKFQKFKEKEKELKNKCMKSLKKINILKNLVKESNSK